LHFFFKVSATEAKFLVVKRELGKMVELQEIENFTRARFKKLKEEYQVSLNLMTSFSYIAIGILILFPIIIIACDLWSFATGFKRESRKSRSSVVPDVDIKTKDFQEIKDKRVFIRNNNSDALKLDLKI
jgi:hypothetical protein